MPISWNEIRDRATLCMFVDDSGIFQPAKSFEEWIDIRSCDEGSDLGLSDPLTMPAKLLKAHQNLDRAVDRAYSRKTFTGDADRVAFLFDRYAELQKRP